MKTIVFIWLDGKIIVGEEGEGRGESGNVALDYPCELLSVTMIKPLPDGAEIRTQRVLAPLGIYSLVVDPDRAAMVGSSLEPAVLELYRIYRARLRGLVLPGDGDSGSGHGN